jgi:hypothetical protein
MLKKDLILIRMYSSNHDSTVTISRPASNANLLISSTDRFDLEEKLLGADKTSASWSLSSKKYALLGYFTRLALIQFQFQWNIPTIITGKNDTITLAFDNGAGSSGFLEAVIPEGFYTGDELANELETAWKADGDYDPAVGLSVNFVKGGFVIDVDPPYECAIDLPEEGPNQNNIFRCIYTLGLGSSVNVFPISDRLVGGIAPLIYTRYLDLRCDAMTVFQRVKDTSSSQLGEKNVIARIYATPPNVSQNASQPGGIYGEPWVMTIDYNTPKYINYDPVQGLANLTFELYDEWNDLMYWSQLYNTEYQMTFIASES